MRLGERAENEVKGVEFTICFRSNHVFGSDIGREQVLFFLREVGKGLEVGGGFGRFPTVSRHPSGEFALSWIGADEEGLTEDEKAAVHSDGFDFEASGKRFFGQPITNESFC